MHGALEVLCVPRNVPSDRPGCPLTFTNHGKGCAGRPWTYPVTGAFKDVLKLVQQQLEELLAILLVPCMFVSGSPMGMRMCTCVYMCVCVCECCVCVFVCVYVCARAPPPYT